MLIGAKRALECYEWSIMDHGSGGFEDQKPTPKKKQTIEA